MYSIITPSTPGREQMLNDCMRSVTEQTVQGHHIVNKMDTPQPFTAWNGMAEAAHGDWIIPLEDDCTLDPDYIEATSRYKDEADIIYTWCRIQDMDVTPNRLFNPRALSRYNYIPPTALIRKKLFHQLGGYQTTTKTDPVWGLWLRALRAGARFKCVPENMWTIRFDKQAITAMKAVKMGAVQKVTELESLLNLVNEKKPRVVVEIGTARGETLWALCQIISQDALVVSIDIPSGSPIDVMGGKDVYTGRNRDAILSYHPNMHLINKNSQSKAAVDELAKILGDKRIDCLLIDGDHRYQGVKADYDNYSPFMSDTGFIAFHDIVRHNDTRVGVHRLWGEVKPHYTDVREFVHHTNPPWGGIGVLL